MKRVLLLLSFVFLTISCQKQKLVETHETTKQNMDTRLLGKWKLTFISPVNGKDIKDLFKIQSPFLHFVDNSKIAGNNGCNNLAGKYTADEKSITFLTNEFITTKMFCEGVNENALTNWLSKVNTYSIVGDGRILNLSMGDAIVLEFEKDKAE